MIWAIQAVVGASDVVPCQYLDVMESIHAPSHYFSYAYSRIFNDMIFGEVCLHRFNFVGVNYDFSMQQVEYGTYLFLAGLVEVFVDILIIWKICDRTFSGVSLSYPI